MKEFSGKWKVKKDGSMIIKWKKRKVEPVNIAQKNQERFMKDYIHNPECPCNNADERGCFLISAKTNKCISCTCEEK